MNTGNLREAELGPEAGEMTNKKRNPTAARAARLLGRLSRHANCTPESHVCQVSK